MEKWYYKKLARIEDSHWWYVARRNIIRKVLNYLDLSANSEILEAGCESGGNLELLSIYGKIHAFEVDDYARDLANKRKITYVEKGSLPDNMPFITKCFDLVAMLDVLEHIDDDELALKSIRAVLKDKGKLLVTVPAYTFLWSDIYFLNHHKRRYLKRKLLSLIKDSGFSIIYSTYFNIILFQIIFIIRLIRNVFKISGKHEDDVPPDIMNNFLNKVFSFESILIPNLSLPFGVSILVIAKAK